jgi:folate-binding protein YgfZ
MENPETPKARDLPDAGTAVYTQPDGRSSPAAGYAALMQGAAVVDLSHRSVLRLSGRDPVGMLNAVLTNEVPGEANLGVYALLLNPKGRVQADLRVLKAPSGDDVLIDTEPEGTAAARGLLGRYAPFSRVTLEDLSGPGETWGVLGLYGPRAKELLGGLELAEHACAGVTPGGVTVLAAGVAVPVAGYDLLGPADALLAARGHLLEGGAIPADPDAYETARIEAGVPRFGTDITPENFPAEAGLLDRAVSFGKGCYPGQETVARMHYRGHPNRTLYRLSAQGPPPTPGAPIFQDEKQVGRITSVAPMPAGGQVLALGYLHRNADPGGDLSSDNARLSILQDQKTAT